MKIKKNILVLKIEKKGLTRSIDDFILYSLFFFYFQISPIIELYIVQKLQNKNNGRLILRDYTTNKYRVYIVKNISISHTICS